MITPLAARLRRTVFAMATLLGAAAILTAPEAAAEPLRVVADIAPVASLAAMVMGDLGAPQVLVPAGASAHALSLRPSQARALQQADLVIWIGPAMAPWLGEALVSLAPKGHALALMEAQGTHLLPARATIAFDTRQEGGEGDVEGHDHDAHDHDAHDHKDHDHDAHDHDAQGEGGHDHEAHHDAQGDESHDAHEAHEAHEAHDAHEGEGDHHGHDHASGADPHVWLAPSNAAQWLDVIAAAMGEADPDNAAQYERNAKAGQAQIFEAAAQARARLDVAAQVPILAFHDAYQYFEKAFDLNVIGAVSLSDASDPGPARIAALRALVRARGVGCAITEPQFAARRLDLVLEGQDVRRIEVDPMGHDLPQGAALYPALILAMAESFARCGAPE